MPNLHPLTELMLCFFNLPVKDLKRNPKIKVEPWKDYLEFKKKGKSWGDLLVVRAPEQLSISKV